MNGKVDNFDDKLEAMSIAMSEWQKLEHMSLENLENKRTEFKTPWTVGNYKISVTLGEQGAFTDGQCNTTASGEEKNCFKDTTMTVYDKDGKSLYTTRTLPLSSGGDSGGKGGKVKQLYLQASFEQYDCGDSDMGYVSCDMYDFYLVTEFEGTKKNGGKKTWTTSTKLGGNTVKQCSDSSFSNRWCGYYSLTGPHGRPWYFLYDGVVYQTTYGHSMTYPLLK